MPPLRTLFAALFVLGGIAHFAFPAAYAGVVPPYLPWPRALVWASGVAEVALGALLLVPAARPAAAWGLVALLVAVFPANLHMALHAADYPWAPPLALWLRLPLQGVLIAWAWAYTRS